MKKNQWVSRLKVSTLAVLMLGALANANQVTAETLAPETKKITVLGTSDVHGNVWDYSYEDNKEADLGFAKIGTIVKQERANNPNLILVDAGDNLQGTLLTDDLYSSNADLQNVPHPVITAMNTIGYDAMALGNHEFNFGTDLILKAEREATFPLLSANTYLKGTDTNFVGSTTVKNIDGVKVAVIGMTIPHVAMWDGDKVSHLDFKPLNEEAKKQVKILQDIIKPDIIIASIHAGLENSDAGAAAINVIKEVPEIDAFVLGHDHREYAEMITDNQETPKPVAAVKDTGSGVVKIDLNLEKSADDGSWKVASSSPSTISVKGVAGDEDVKAATKEAHDKTVEYVQGVVGQASGDFLPEERIPGIPEAQLQPTAMISLINNVQMQVTGADLGSAALFKADSRLNEGPIKYSDIFNIYKYPNTFVGTTMTGAQLKTYLEKQGAYYQQFEAGDLTIAFNSKIRVYNYDIVSGVKYKIDISQPEGSRIKDLTFQEKEVLDTDTFKIAMNNYRFEGMVADGLVNPEPYFESDPDTLRGEIVKYIKEKGTINPEEEIENNFELIGYNLEHPARDYVVKQIKAGTPGFEIQASADGRTPNVKKININDLIAAGLIPEEELEGDKDFTFTIMHTNDMHGRLQYEENKSIGMAKLKTFKDIKNPTLMLDGGDSVQGLAISNFSEGMDMAKAMELLPYDGVAAGNHEFDFGYDRAMSFKDLLPMVSANVEKDGKNSFAPYEIVEKEGKKFAIIGLSTPETAFKTHPKNVEGVTFKDPIPVAKATINELEGQADAFIFVTHLGIDPTTPEEWRGDTLAKELSETFPKGKIIVIDGHSHSALREGKQYGNVLLAQTGNYLNNVGMITVSYKDDVPTFQAELVPASEFKEVTENPAVKVIVDETAKRFEAVMSEVVLGDNPVSLEGDGAYGRTRETNLGNLIADALYDYGQTGFNDGQTDLAVINGGGIRTSIETGKVTKGDLLAVLPFGNTIAQIDVTGKQLIEMFEYSLRSDIQKDEAGNPIMDDVTKMPLLGRNGGFLQVSKSVQLQFDPNKMGAGNKAEDNQKGERVWSLKLLNKRTGQFEVVKDDQIYKLATNDFLAAGGDGYTMLGGKREEGPSMDVIFTEFLQDITTDSKAKVVSLKSKEYDLADYSEAFPYTRLVPAEKTEEVVTVEQDNLAKTIAGVKALKEADYTAHSWSNLQKVVKTAETEHAAKDENRAKQANAELVSAKQDLVSIKSLTTLVTESQKLKEADYTEASWKTFATALKNAESLLKKASDATVAVTFEEALGIENALVQGKEGLVKVSNETPNQTALAETIKKYQALAKSDYTAHSWSIFAEVLASAEEELTLKDETKAAEANEALTTAFSELVSVKELKALVEASQQLKEADYTKASWYYFAKELTEAEALLKAAEDVDKEVTVKDLAAQVTALSTAKSNLIKVGTNGSNGSNSTSKKYFPQTGEELGNYLLVGVALISISGFIIYRKRKAA